MQFITVSNTFPRLFSLPAAKCDAGITERQAAHTTPDPLNIPFGQFVLQNLTPSVKKCEVPHDDAFKVKRGEQCCREGWG